MTYWPWWVGAGSLAVITTGFWLVHKRPLGVSGSWARLIQRHYDKERDQAESPFRNNPELLKDALMEATIQEFGEEAVREALSKRPPDGTLSPLTPVQVPIRISWTAHLTFLLMLVVGGLIATMLGNGFKVHPDLGELHRQYFGSGFGYWLILFTGGAMIGFGTQLSGGCTSGHALSGFSRLIPASIIATVTFFASAVITSLLISVM